MYDIHCLKFCMEFIEVPTVHNNLRKQPIKKITVSLWLIIIISDHKWSRHMGYLNALRDMHCDIT